MNFMYAIVLEQTSIYPRDVLIIILITMKLMEFKAIVLKCNCKRNQILESTYYNNRNRILKCT